MIMYRKTVLRFQNRSILFITDCLGTVLFNATYGKYTKLLCLSLSFPSLWWQRLCDPKGRQTVILQVPIRSVGKVSRVTITNDLSNPIPMGNFQSKSFWNILWQIAITCYKAKQLLYLTALKQNYVLDLLIPKQSTVFM